MKYANLAIVSRLEVDDEFNLPISVAIVVLLIYIFVGATMYYIWENWGFFESFYFVFISMSTIGFGDFVPQVIEDFVSYVGRCRIMGGTHMKIDPTST